MKPAEEIIEEMFKRHDPFYTEIDIKWAMNEYEIEVRKDERINLLKILQSYFYFADNTEALSHIQDLLIKQTEPK